MRACAVLALLASGCESERVGACSPPDTPFEVEPTGFSDTELFVATTEFADTCEVASAGHDLSR